MKVTEENQINRLDDWRTVFIQLKMEAFLWRSEKAFRKPFDEDCANYLKNIKHISPLNNP